MGIRRWVLIMTTAAAVVLGAAFPGTAEASPRFPTAGDRITVQVASDQRSTYSYWWIDGRNAMAPRTSGVGMTLRDYNPRTRLWSTTTTFVAQKKRQQTAANITSWGGYAQCTIWVNGVRVRHHVYRAPIFAQAQCGINTLDANRIDHR
ncbi:hypothetical protein [Gordonia sp. 'Campus']|uniref:hypothetical protein n=1 Tax=Gordonia sp. 'Campus' TaxID=2915824 RepID=UPI001EE3FB26|nr:hypothetical protein [Gordonia sp. 'Campus']